MSRTKEEYAEKNAKMTGAKGSVTRSCRAMERLCKQLGEVLKRKDTDFPERTAKKIAEDISKSRGSIETNLENLENTPAILTEVISGMKAEETQEKDLDKMAEKVSDDIEEYFLKYEALKTEYTKTLEEADRLVSPVKPPVTTQSREPSSTNGYERFTAYSDLKPTYLNQDSTMIEINQWCSQLNNYLNMGYRGNPPTTGISMHLAPLMHSSWIQALESKNLEEKTLGELTAIIKEEGKLRMPVHQRRLQLLKAKRNQTRHTEFIFQLEKLMSVAEFDKMSSDEMVIHLFAETANSTMSKIGLEIISAELS